MAALNVLIAKGEYKGQIAQVKSYSNDSIRDGNQYRLKIDGQFIYNGDYTIFFEDFVFHFNKELVNYTQETPTTTRAFIETPYFESFLHNEINTIDSVKGGYLVCNAMYTDYNTGKRTEKQTHAQTDWIIFK